MSFDDIIGKIGEVIDAAGVAVIVLGTLIAAVSAATRLSRGEARVYSRFRRQLGQNILLGLELLVAADIIRTVAAQLTVTGVGILGLIVAIRTFLSFSLEVELTGHWPWQQGDTRSPPE
jgi:uncharacterized membrane protein